MLSQSAELSILSSELHSIDTALNSCCSDNGEIAALRVSCAHEFSRLANLATNLRSASQLALQCDYISLIKWCRESADHAFLVSRPVWFSLIHKFKLLQCLVWTGDCSITVQHLAGFNSIILCPSRSVLDLPNLARVIDEALLSRRPSRIALVCSNMLMLGQYRAHVVERLGSITIAVLSNSISLTTDPIDSTSWRGRALPRSWLEQSNGVTRALRWFDSHSASASSNNLPHIAHECRDELRSAWLEADTFDRYAGSLGVLPTMLDVLLHELRPELRWKDIESLKVSLRACIFDAAFRRWTERCCLNDQFVKWQRQHSQSARQSPPIRHRVGSKRKRMDGS